MAATSGSLYVHRLSDGIVFRVEGRATRPLSQPLRRVAEQCLQSGAKTIRLDLRACTFMDSTFLGTLLLLRRAVQDRAAGNLALIDPSSECVRLLGQMGVADLFPSVKPEPAGQATWVELVASDEDAQACKQHVLQSHRELAALEGAPGEPFRAVMRSLEQDSDKKPTHP